MNAMQGYNVETRKETPHHLSDRSLPRRTVQRQMRRLGREHVCGAATAHKRVADPKKVRNKVGLLSLLLSTFLFIGSGYLPFRVLYNRSDSMPRGFYFVGPADDIRPGDIVGFLPPLEITSQYTDREWLPPADVIWLKIVVAGPGEFVCRHSVERYDSKGRPLYPIPFCGRLAQGKFWLETPRSHSFDSRYFGAIHHEKIKYKVRWMIE